MKTKRKRTPTREATTDSQHGSKLLLVQEQSGNPQQWALVDLCAKTAPRTLRVYGTKHEIPKKPGKWVGSLLLDGGALVYHVFEDSAAEVSRER
jgi:hypothetical protein